MPQKLEIELKRVERLEEEIESSINSIEKQSSFSLVLLWGIVLGVLSNIGASIIYEIHLKSLSSLAQTTVAVIVIFAIPLVVLLLVKEFKKTKKQKQILMSHLETVREHKKRIK